MKIKITRNTVAGGKTALQGDVIEISDREGVDLIRLGKAMEYFDPIGSVDIIEPQGGAIELPERGEPDLKRVEHSEFIADIIDPDLIDKDLHEETLENLYLIAAHYKIKNPEKKSKAALIKAIAAEKFKE